MSYRYVRENLENGTVQTVCDTTYWACDHCSKRYVVSESGRPMHTRRKPGYGCAYMPPAKRDKVSSMRRRWGKAHKLVFTLGTGPGNVAHYCSDECVEPHDLAEIRLTIAGDEVAP